MASEISFFGAFEKIKKRRELELWKRQNLPLSGGGEIAYNEVLEEWERDQTMEIQMIGANSMLIYASAAELDQRNMDAGSLDLQDVLLLTREACCKGGVPVADMVEIEAYSDGDSAMVFLRLRELRRQWIEFQDLPTLLDGLAALPEPDCDEMGFWNGKYFLSAGEGVAGLLSEFGQTPSRSIQYALRKMER